jgi:hypothetical protein
MILSLRSVGIASISLFISLWSTAQPVVYAQSVDTTECLSQTYDALAHEKRVYRSVLFGQKKSKDLPTGSVRFDKDGNTWLKKDTNRWVSLLKDSNAKADLWMDDHADVDVRRGIMEIRKAPTSDLIPAITQAFRAYQCRLTAVCDAGLKSQTTETGTTTIKVQPEGCIELEEPVLTSCKKNIQPTVGTDTCSSIVSSMLDQEQQTLSLLIAYDASYRTLYQFEGIFEGFLQDFRFPLIEPLWQTVRAIGGLSHIPCFLGQCDE